MISDKQYEVLGYVCWTPPAPAQDILGDLPPHYIMAVAIKTMFGWKAYMGFAVEAWGPELSANHIAGTGVKVTREQAIGMFPNLKAKDFVY